MNRHMNANSISKDLQFLLTEDDFFTRKDIPSFDQESREKLENILERYDCMPFIADSVYTAKQYYCNNYQNKFPGFLKETARLTALSVLLELVDSYKEKYGTLSREKAIPLVRIWRNISEIVYCKVLKTLIGLTN